MKPLITAITGYARSGKDTLAAYLAPEYGHIVSLATPLKGIAGEIVGAYSYEKHEMDTKASNVYTDEFKVTKHFDSDKTGRDVLIELGDLIRSWNSNFFARALTKRIEKDFNRYGKVRFIVPDLRRKNEDAYLRRWAERHGCIYTSIRVERPGVGPAADHQTEHETQEILVDYVINNDGDLEQLQERARMFRRLQKAALRGTVE